MGCTFVRQKGSHRVYWRDDQVRPVIIPTYTHVPVFVIRNILRQLNIQVNTCGCSTSCKRCFARFRPRRGDATTPPLPPDRALDRMHLYVVNRFACAAICFPRKAASKYSA